ncbi:MAG: ABA4-like family protein [Synechococcales bacterium]|nr:ABA4-like family protein [Synechococcales bacterium]
MSLELPLELLYNGANLFVLPFWVLMVFLPNWGVTRTVMASFLPFVALAVLYVYLFVTGITPESLEAFSSNQLADVARLFADEHIAATGWVHFLVIDLFVGRWIYWDGQQNRIFTVHSLVLALFAGPMGLLSHILTRWLTLRGSQTAPGEGDGPATADAPEPSSP